MSYLRFRFGWMRPDSCSYSMQHCLYRLLWVYLSNDIIEIPIPSGEVSNGVTLLILGRQGLQEAIHNAEQQWCFDSMC